ncbi:MAG: flippase [Patescibacteria group bacterium]|nr:flippase [Patescibacteria group bacterium]MDD4610570.1 flippase [Patescibacteria group bacterium]
MRLSTKVAYNTIIQVAGKIISTILALIAVAVITRYLGQTGFGQFTIATTFVSFFAIIADFGLTLVTVQMISRPGINKNKILNNLFSLRLVSALFLLCLAPLAVMFFPYEPIVKLAVLLTIISFLFVALNQILVGLFQRELRMDKISIAEIVSRVFLLVGVIVVAKEDYGLIGVIGANVLAAMINFVLHFVFSRPYARIRLEFDFTLWREIFRKSWPLAITIALNLIYLRADTLILSIFKSEAEVGLYGAAYKVIDVLTAIPFMFAGLVLPILTISWTEKNKEYFKKVLLKSFDLMAILAIPMAVGAQFTSREIMSVVAGADFAASGTILQILIAAVVFIFLACMFSHAIIAIDKQKKLIGAYLFVSLTSLALYFILIPRYSYYGAAAVTIYSELTIAVFVVYYVWKYAGILPNWLVAIKSLAASMVMGAVLYVLPPSFYEIRGGIFLVLGVGAIVYFLFLYLLRGLTKEDLRILSKK